MEKCFNAKPDKRLRLMGVPLLDLNAAVTPEVPSVTLLHLNAPLNPEEFCNYLVKGEKQDSKFVQMSLYKVA
jgi:hypothetical protein